MKDSRVLVFSIALGAYDRLFERCIETQREYCGRHGYEYVLVDRAPRSLRPKEAAWLKIPLIRSALGAGYEWVAFIDADCEIRGNTPSFPEHHGSLAEGKSLFMAPGFSGRINSGVVFVRNTPAAVDFFDRVIAHADQEVPRTDRTAYENGHIIFFGKNSPDVHLLDHTKWNNNSRLDARSYIQHYSGGPLRQWYKSNLASAEFGSGSGARLRRMIRKAIRKLGTSRTSGADKELSISASIDELLPYYQRKYPAFGHAAQNA